MITITKKDLTTSDKLLVVKTLEGIRKRYPEVTDHIRHQTEHELNTIINMGFSDYFLIVQDFLDIGRRCGYMPDDRLNWLREHYQELSINEMNDYINEDQSMPGLTIGPGRGSAAGSIVTFALGITSIDPIKEGLLFERFLNPERVSMPDIDSDISKANFEYGVRDIVIGYVSKKYGVDGVCGITTPSTLAAKAAIENVARIHGSKLYNDKTAFLKLGEKMKALITKDMNGFSDASPVIREVFKDNRDALDILSIAERVEDLNANHSRHACGNIIVDNHDVGAYAPLMLEEDSGQWKIAMDAETAETQGFLKMDFLGLKNLNVITKTLRLIYANSGRKIDPIALPEEKDVFLQVFAKGLTNSIFQFSSTGMKQMLKKFVPDKFSDLVLLVACYRPGPLQYLDGIIARKHGQEAEENAVTRIASYNKAFHDIVSPTYFALVYQEQIMEVFKQLAGYSMGGADNVRRAMGHKKMDVLVAEKQNFVYGNADKNIRGAIATGVKEQDALDLFEEMIEFAKYSFNKSHAAAYAEIAYITGWFKFYYPTEFYASVLNFENFDMYQGLIHEAKLLGVEVKAPDINNSRRTFTGKNNTLYFGFSGIKGLKDATISDIEEKETRYTSFSDFIKRTNAGQADINLMISAGCFDSLCENRAALHDILPDYMIEKEVIKKRTKEISTFNEMLKDIESGEPLSRTKYKITTKNLPTKEQIEKKRETSQERIQDALDAIDCINIPYNMFEDMKARYDSEQNALGLFVTGSPLDLYSEPDTTPISDISEGNISVYGAISGIRETKTKKDGQKIAFFTLEDNTGKISVCVFQDAYPKFAALITEGNIVKIKGRAGIKKGTENTEDPEMQIIASSISECEEKRSSYEVFCQDITEYCHVIEMARLYKAEKGHELKCLLAMPERVITVDFEVHTNFMKDRTISNRIVEI